MMSEVLHSEASHDFLQISLTKAMTLSCISSDEASVSVPFKIPLRASFVAQLVKNLPAMWETWVQSLGWKDPLKRGRAIHSRILAWRIPWTVKSMGSQRVEHD